MGMLRKSEPAVPALLLSGKQREVYSSVCGCTSDLTLVSYVPALTRLSSSIHHSIMMTHEWVKKKITNLQSGQAFEGIHLCEINHVLVFETVPHLD
jgi:hypothetical protein